MPDLDVTLTPDAISSSLAEGRQAYVAVRSRYGPHITPELYSWSQGRLWFAFATPTVKANVLARDPVAAVSVSVGGRSVLLRGPVELVDPRRPDRLALRPWRIPATALALSHYTVRNAPDLLAFVTDLGRARLGWRPPPLRVLAALRPTSVALIDGDQVRTGSGALSQARRDVFDRPPGGRPVVVGLPGPLATPGRWFDEERTLWIPPPLLPLVSEVGRFPIGIVDDEYTAPGPAAKEGTLLRGTAERTDREGILAVEPERIVGWDGIETTSTAAG